MSAVYDEWCETNVEQSSLTIVKKNYYWRVLCELSATFKWKKERKTVTFSKERKVLFYQYSEMSPTSMVVVAQRNFKKMVWRKGLWIIVKNQVGDIVISYFEDHNKSV